MDPKDKDLSREEDYRDYEERDIEGGWPYDDDAGAKSKRPANRAYGETAANFDRENNKGYTVVDTDADGDQKSQTDDILPGTIGREELDDIEERVMNAFMEVEGVSPEMIDITSDDNVVTLEGEVDDMATRRQLERIALRVPGVRKVRNNIEVIGVDANIPDED